MTPPREKCNSGHTQIIYFGPQVEVHIAADDFIILRLFLAISMEYSSQSTLHSTPNSTPFIEPLENVAKIYDACDTVNSCSTPKHISNVWHDLECQRIGSEEGYLLYPELEATGRRADRRRGAPPNNNVKYVRRFAIHTQKWMRQQQHRATAATSSGPFETFDLPMDDGPQ